MSEDKKDKPEVAEDQKKLDRDAKLQKLGVDPKMVDALKQQHGRVELVVIQKQPYIYRALKRLEWKQLVDQAAEAGADNMAAQEMAVQRCVLYPEGLGANIALTGAGVAATLSEGIMKFSGFGADEEPLEL